LTVCRVKVLKLAEKLFTSLFFGHCDRVDLIFVGHLKKIPSMTEKKQPRSV